MTRLSMTLSGRVLIRLKQPPTSGAAAGFGAACAKLVWPATRDDASGWRVSTSQPVCVSPLNLAGLVACVALLLAIPTAAIAQDAHSPAEEVETVSVGKSTPQAAQDAEVEPLAGLEAEAEAEAERLARLEEERLLAEQRQFIYPLTDPEPDIVGWLRTVEITDAKDTLVDVGRRYKYGFDAIKAANPGVDPWLPEVGATIILPGRYILPAAPRRGIVINVSEKRLYYYPRMSAGEEATVEIYAVSVGRGDWGTPLKTTKVTGMVKHPTWYPPASVRAEHEERGDSLPRAVPAGPDNPLGDYVISLSIPSYFIHGTNRENGVGMQVTHGCIRMYPIDIDRLANSVPKGTPVHIVNQRYKAGWMGGALYLEAHPPLEGAGDSEDLGSRSLTRTLSAIREEYPGVVLDWAEVWRVQREQSGIPTAIGKLSAEGKQVMPEQVSTGP